LIACTRQFPLYMWTHPSLCMRECTTNDERFYSYITEPTPMWFCRRGTSLKLAVKRNANDGLPRLQCPCAVSPCRGVFDDSAVSLRMECRIFGDGMHDRPPPGAGLHYPARRQLINWPTNGAHAESIRTTHNAQVRTARAARLGPAFSGHRSPEDWGLAVETEWTRGEIYGTSATDWKRFTGGGGMHAAAASVSSCTRNRLVQLCQYSRPARILSCQSSDINHFHRRRPA